MHSPSSYSCNIPNLHGTWVHEPQLPWHKIWGSWTHVPCKLGILHEYDDDTSKPSLQGWPLHWIVPPGLHWSGDGHGMVMVCLSKKSWEVCTSVYHNHIYTHTCVYVITSISPGNASHVNILCTCTPLYTLSERYTCISYRSRLADIPLLCVAVCGMWVLDQL